MDGRRGTGHIRKSESRLILIGIQARTDSTRLPGKCNLEIAGKTILEHVVEACEHAAAFFNRNHSRYNATVKTAILVPGKDPITERYGKQFPIWPFPEFNEGDVLSRYVFARQDTKADFVVRITADCIFTAPYLISRCVKAAIYDGHDYVSNVLTRTFREGMDVEVLSPRLLEWLDKNAKGKDREHVTSLIKEQWDAEIFPRTFKVHHITNDTDDSHLKTSIDTMEDYNAAVAEFDSRISKKRRALAHGDTVS